MKKTILILNMVLAACGTEKDKTSTPQPASGSTNSTTLANPSYDRNCVDAKAKQLDDPRLPLNICLSKADGTKETQIFERTNSNVDADSCLINFEELGLEHYRSIQEGSTTVQKLIYYGC